MKRVFISYSHDSQAHCQRVLGFAEQLRGVRGISVVIDRDTGAGGPPEGWPQWSERQVIEADLVLVACTAAYCQCYEGQQAFVERLGAVCEARAVRQQLHDCAGINHKFRVLLFEAADRQHIPEQLKPYHFFDAAQDYAELVDWLSGKVFASPQPVPADVGLRWPLPDPTYAWPLADRREPFVMFEQAITGVSAARILFFHGPSSTGKTALRDALLAYAQRLRGVDVAAFDFKGCPSLDQFFESLKLDLGPAILRQACQASGIARGYALLADLQQLAAPLVLILDTWESASQEAQDWVEKEFLSRIDKAPRVVVVLAGQCVPEHHRCRWANTVTSCALQPIQQIDVWLAFAREQMQCTSIERHQVETLTLATRGDPGLLSALLANLAGSARPTQGGGA